MTDLLYFGKDYEDGYNIEKEFLTEIAKEFPQAKLSNAYDYIKGHRQEVVLPDDQENEFYAWCVAFGYIYSSMTLQLMMLDGDEALRGIINQAKTKYPQNFRA